MSEQETEVDDAPPAYIDWSNWSEETPASELPITHVSQLQDGGRECKSEMFAALLEAYAMAPAGDDTLGIMCIKAGVDERKDVQEKDAKEKTKRSDLISTKLQEIAQTSSVEPTENEEKPGTFSPSLFEMLLKGFKPAEKDDQKQLDDKAQGIALVKAAVAGEGVEAQATKEALIAAFEEEHFAKEPEVAPAAEPEAVPDAAPVKEAAPATTSAAVTKAISDFREEFRAVAARLRDVEAQNRSQAIKIKDQAILIATQADRITALESGRKEDHAAVTEIGESVIELAGTVKTNADSVVRLLAGDGSEDSDGGVYGRLGKLETAAKEQKAANEQEGIRNFPRKRQGLV